MHGLVPEEGVCYGEEMDGLCDSAVASLLSWNPPRFEEENQRLLELNQRCQFAASATMQWLDIRLQLMGAAVVSAIAAIALVQYRQGLANPGATCLSHAAFLPQASPCPLGVPTSSVMTPFPKFQF